MKLKIGIIDYGTGNWASIKNILFSLGFKAIISSDQQKLKEAQLILLPGVGAFKPAMDAIKERKLDTFIYEMLDKKKPIIGICLGMQLLGRSSLETNYTKGLNIISQDVFPLGKNSCHIGWNSLRCTNRNSIFKDYESEDFYFNHSYAFLTSKEYTVCETTFKKKSFSSIIIKDKIAGLQFHPEKSQLNGLDLLKRLILELCRDG